VTEGRKMTEGEARKMNEDEGKMAMEVKKGNMKGG
jgi:hypothetical protein